ncbi:MAG: LysR family transcriptional regulator [Pararhodobacter sp.]|nr:LysR family transcriptional regulator [Pararhodobacter sp.]
MKVPDWNHIRAFHATATTGSLSAAARKLGLTQPTLSRQVAALEAELGVSLFERIGRRLQLTGTGMELLEHVNDMSDAARSVAIAASGRVQGVRGRVSISATDTYAAYILPPIIERIRREAPEITVAIMSSNALANLRQQEADIAIRHVAPDDPALVGLHLRDSDAGFYASRHWIERHGMPARPDDLAGPELLGIDDAERYIEHLRQIGIPMEAGAFRLVSDNSVVIWEMVRRGMGVAAMLAEVATRTPGIVRLMPDLLSFAVPVWLVSHRELHSSRRIRVVHDILAGELAQMDKPAPML